MAAAKLEPFLARLRRMDEADTLDADEIEAFLRDLRPRIKRKRYETVAGHLQEGYLRRAIEALDVPDASLPMVSILIGAAFVVFGLVTFQWGGELVDEAEASVRWPSVEGIVTASEVSASRYTAPGQARRDETTYRPDVTYTYQVDGQDYTGHRVSYRASGDRKSAEEVVARYPAGKVVQVHHDPKAPGTATLEVGSETTTGILLQAGWLFVGLGLIWLAASFFIYWYNRP